MDAKNKHSTRGRKAYNNKLDKITWKEMEMGGVSESKASTSFKLNDTLHFILTNRSIISHASLPNLTEARECKGCGCTVPYGEQCLKLSLSKDGETKNDAYFCNNCTK